MGIENRLSRLEGREKAASAEAEDQERLRIERSIMRAILGEFDRLNASGKLSSTDPLARAVRSAAHDQYGGVQSPEVCECIADGWIETIRDWTRLDWLLTTDRDGPPRA